MSWVRGRGAYEGFMNFLRGLFGASRAGVKTVAKPGGFKSILRNIGVAAAGVAATLALPKLADLSVRGQSLLEESQPAAREIERELGSRPAGFFSGGPLGSGVGPFGPVLIVGGLGLFALILVSLLRGRR